jgi:SAM-dependent methyltransferase
MSLFYKFQYLVGLTPWEKMPSLPIGEQASALLDREQAERELPFGRALDLGCGTGYWSVQLAQRGWDVTGIDSVPKALRVAQQRARAAGTSIRFVNGSVTDLASAGIETEYRLALDFGCVHGLTPEQVLAAASEVSAVSAADATLLMYAFSPMRRGPLPRGIDRAEIEHAYTAWEIADEIAFDLSQAPGFVQKARPRFYRLRRKHS